MEGGKEGVSDDEIDDVDDEVMFKMFNDHEKWLGPIGDDVEDDSNVQFNSNTIMDWIPGGGKWGLTKNGQTEGKRKAREIRLDKCSQFGQMKWKKITNYRLSINCIIFISSVSFTERLAMTICSEVNRRMVLFHTSVSI